VSVSVEPRTFLACYYGGHSGEIYAAGRGRKPRSSASSQEPRRSWDQAPILQAAVRLGRAGLAYGHRPRERLRSIETAAAAQRLPQSGPSGPRPCQGLRLRERRLGKGVGDDQWRARRERSRVIVRGKIEGEPEAGMDASMRLNRAVQPSYPVSTGGSNTLQSGDRDHADALRARFIETTVQALARDGDLIAKGASNLEDRRRSARIRSRRAYPGMAETPASRRLWRATPLQSGGFASRRSPVRSRLAPFLETKVVRDNPTEAAGRLSLPADAGNCVQAATTPGFVRLERLVSINRAVSARKQRSRSAARRPIGGADASSDFDALRGRSSVRSPTTTSAAWAYRRPDRPLCSVDC
jgi:hypothetical protein